MLGRFAVPYAIWEAGDTATNVIFGVLNHNQLEAHIKQQQQIYQQLADICGRGTAIGACGSAQQTQNYIFKLQGQAAKNAFQTVYENQKTPEIHIPRD